MPNRILREGILTSERVDSLSWPEECFYRRLISVVDDFGRFSAHPKLLRAACYPLKLDKVSDPDIGKWLSACETAGLVRVYTVEVDADDRKGRSETGKPADVSRTLPKRYLQLEDFRQDVRAKKSKYPAPGGACIADDPHLRSTCIADDPHLRSTCIADDPHLRSETETETKTNNANAPQAPAVVVPFSSKEFTEAWARFLQHRRELKKPLKPTAEAELLKEAAAHTEADAIAAIHKSIVSGWPGVYFDGRAAPNGSKPATPADEERRKRKERERRAYNDQVAAEVRAQFAVTKGAA